ncbi:MAG: MCP four helix bundle domain-containing protein [Proteobacteria bacterium]|nr:MCP four helix bundle domain-containing protein [Pseudomonadota bacterium]
MKRLSLRVRIFALLTLLVLVNLAGAVVTLWYAGRTQEVYARMVDRNVNALIAAQKIQADLVMQKGFVTYYFLNEDPEWLRQLDQYHRQFEKDLEQARKLAHLDGARQILNDLQSQYLRFAFTRDQVIGLYKAGKKEEGAKKHWSVRDRFHAIYDLCEQYKRLHETRIQTMGAEYKKTAFFLSSVAWAAIPVAVLLGALLSYVLLTQVLGPVRRLAAEGEKRTGGVEGNEVRALDRRFHGLLHDRNEAHQKLSESREHLIQAEKMALVGKLSAGVAHSIRNPLTSVKMRLFSLERSLDMDKMQKEDFEVIAEEIRHLDTIIGNFLEFARPPRLRMQVVSPSDVVENTLQLLRHRLESYGVDVSVQRDGPLPRVLADPEQLKEVFVNLLMNACEAMPGGGAVAITEQHAEKEVSISFEDNGPGIPESARDKVFEPFFSSKEEGTGLGLSIARRIIAEHGGSMSLGGNQDSGANFVVTLPGLEEKNWPTS